MPGEAACAALHSTAPSAARETGSTRFIGVAFLVVVAANIAVPLQHADFGHLAAEVLRIVRQVVELWRVQLIGPLRHRRGALGGRVGRSKANQTRIEDDSQRL